jgi:hypothetical protein
MRMDLWVPSSVTVIGDIALILEDLGDIALLTDAGTSTLG